MFKLTGMNWNGRVCTDARFVDVVGELAVTLSARFCRHVRKQPSGENDVQDGELKDWSDETSE